MRIILFTGKGGVGKTTTAASYAVDAARAGIRTLVLSTDPAHSLLDAFGMAPQDRASNDPLRLEPGLDALQVTGPHAVDASWRVVQEYLLAVLDAIGLDPVVAEELTELPGAEEIAALVELAGRARSGCWDLIVVDCAPTAETLRLLALPEALAWHLGRLMPAQRALIRTLRPAAAAATGIPVPAPEVIDTVRSWQDEMREVHELLTGPTASVHLVVTPERVVLAESRRMWTSLSLHGFTVDEVVVNRVLPAGLAGPDEDSWLASWNAAQREGLREVTASFAGLPIAHAPFLAAEPIGTDALTALAQATTRGVGDQGAPGADDSVSDRTAPDRTAATRAADLLAPVARPAMRVSRRGVGYQLTLTLPFADAADVDLKRRGADLLVAVGQHRRVLTLPSALQRCVVSSAAVQDGVLRVRFLPDERLWPRDDST